MKFFSKAQAFAMSTLLMGTAGCLGGLTYSADHHPFSGEPTPDFKMITQCRPHVEGSEIPYLRIEVGNLPMKIDKSMDFKIARRVVVQCNEGVEIEHFCPPDRKMFIKVFLGNLSYHPNLDPTQTYNSMLNNASRKGREDRFYFLAPLDIEAVSVALYCRPYKDALPIKDWHPIALN